MFSKISLAALLVVLSAATAWADPAGDPVRTPTPNAYAASDISRVLFLNRCKGGCVIQPGPDNARTNQSSIATHTSTLTEFAYGDDVWNQVVQCVTELYAPYNVTVTDVDPGNTAAHHEAIVAGSWNELLDTAAGGISSFSCAPRNNVISFTFANDAGANAEYICSVVGQESAHSYGLEHSFNCADPMTYLPACGRQFFRDADAPCGEFAARDCVCKQGASLQNTHKWLIGVLGPNPTPPAGPTVSLATPADGDKVAKNFAVGFTGSDVRGIGAYRLLLNGTEVASGDAKNATTITQVLNTPADQADGLIDLELHVADDIGDESITKATVQKGAPCKNADACNAGQDCNAGHCVYVMGNLGDPCSDARQCSTNVCPAVGSGDRVCSQDCFPSTAENTCPDGFECMARNASQGYCYAAASTGGCGCQDTGSADASLLGLGIGAVMLLVRRRRAA